MRNFLGWPWTEVNDRMYGLFPSISTTALNRLKNQGIPRSGVKDNDLNFAPRVDLPIRLQ